MNHSLHIMFIYPRFPPLLRHARSTSTLSNLSSTLKARTLPILYDYLTPQPSHLLSTTLVDHLPFLSSDLPARLPSTSKPQSLPLAHHLVYFPTPTAPSLLLPDGTDTLHSPGPPFTNRLWAGGRVRFPRNGGPPLDGTRAAIVEGIRDVRVSGPAGAEKVFVGIERRVARVKEKQQDDHIRKRVWTDEEADEGDAIIIERRDLCFLQPPKTATSETSKTSETSDTAAAAAAATESDPPPFTHRRLLPPPVSPEFIYPLVPDPPLLFRFSALTYNAHAIHLDPLYTRTQYGHPDLLVHGPLLLTLMLTCLKHELTKSERAVREITYRCLAPVYVGEVIRICGRKGSGSGSRNARGKGTRIEDEAQQRLMGEQSWEVWVEKGGDAATGEGAALVARGTVRTEDMALVAEEANVGGLLVLSPVSDFLAL